MTTDAFLQGLAELRNTPRQDGRSPAQIVFGRPIRSLMPAHWSTFDKDQQQPLEKAETAVKKYRAYTKDHYNASAKDLPPLQVGQAVRVQHHTSKRWDQVGKIERVGANRSYCVYMPSGRRYWRNRKFLRPDKSLPVERKRALKSQLPKTPQAEGASKPAQRKSNRVGKKTVRFGFDA